MGSFLSKDRGNHLISGAAHWQPATCRFKVTSCCTSPSRWLIDEQHSPRCLQAASLCPLSDTTKYLFLLTRIIMVNSCLFRLRRLVSMPDVDRKAETRDDGWNLWKWIKIQIYKCKSTRRGKQQSGMWFSDTGVTNSVTNDWSKSGKNPAKTGNCVYTRSTSPYLSEKG